MLSAAALNAQDGLMLFKDIVSIVSLPFLVPLAALFHGGPAIVDEMEGRTLTYLTLRPIPRPAIFLGKSQYGWRDRDDGKVQVAPGGAGVLVVPGIEDLDTWMAKASEQQAQYREAPQEMIEDRAKRKARAMREQQEDRDE